MRPENSITDDIDPSSSVTGYDWLLLWFEFWCANIKQPIGGTPYDPIRTSAGLRLNMEFFVLNEGEAIGEFNL